MVSRRFFLKSSGLALVAFGAAPRALVRSVYAAEGAGAPQEDAGGRVPARRDGRPQRGGPYADPVYRRFRPTIALPAPRGGAKDAALDLDGYFGLHPSLEPLLPLWKDGTLAAVQAVGSPDPTRSHFDAQDFMESGTPGRKVDRRRLDQPHLQCASSPEATPFRAVSLTPTLPRSLAGRAPAVAMNSIREFDLRPSAGARVASGFEGMYEGAVKDVLHGTGQETFEAIQFLKKSDPSALCARGGRGVSARALWRQPQAGRAAHQGRRRASRSRSPRSADGTTTRRKAACRASSPSASGSWASRWPPSRRTSATACRTSCS